MGKTAELSDLNKPALYCYFKTGNKILIFSFEDQLNDRIEEKQKIAPQNLTGTDAGNPEYFFKGIKI
jgi:hypothetical protein